MFHLWRCRRSLCLNIITVVAELRGIVVETSQPMKRSQQVLFPPEVLIDITSPSLPSSSISRISSSTSRQSPLGSLSCIASFSFPPLTFNPWSSTNLLNNLPFLSPWPFQPSGPPPSPTKDSTHLRSSSPQPISTSAFWTDPAFDRHLGCLLMLVSWRTLPLTSPLGNLT